MTKRSMTAAELLDKLKADRAFNAAQEETEAAAAVLAADVASDESRLVGEARSIGFDIDSVWDFVNVGAKHAFLRRRFNGPYGRAYPLLVSHLAIEHHPRVREGIIRALTVRDGGEPVWRALLSEFEREQDPSSRWLLANALRVAMPRGVRAKYPKIAQAFGRGSAR